MGILTRRKRKLFVPMLWIAASVILQFNIFCSGTFVHQLNRPHMLRVRLNMGKGDGKKRRKKASASSTSESSSISGTSTEPEPLRVTSNSIVSVRRQIEWARIKKEMNASSGSSFRNVKAKTSYRKQGPVGPDELAEARNARKEKATDDWAVWTNSTSSPLVIVDGYNVIYQWPRLKKHMMSGNIKRARETLITDLEELKIVKGWRIEVVFDGKFRSTKGVLGDDVGGEKITAVDMETKSKDVSKGVRVTYSGIGTSADTYIEARCFQAKNVTEGKMTGSLIVVTDDNLIRVAAVSAGAVLVSSDRLIDELKVVRKAIMYKIESAIAKETGGPMRHQSLHGKHEQTTFKMGKFEVIDKRNTTNTRQERWRKKIAEKKATKERMLSSISDERLAEQVPRIEVGSKLPSIKNIQKPIEVSMNADVNTTNKSTPRSITVRNDALNELTKKFEEPGLSSPKGILNEYYQIQHKISVNLKNQYITQSKTDGPETIWNADFLCPITKQRFSAGLYGEEYVLDKDTYEVWFHTKAVAEHAAAHTALRQLLYS